MIYNIHVYVTLLIIHDTSNPGSFYWRHCFSMLIVRQAHQFLNLCFSSTAKYTGGQVDMFEYHVFLFGQDRICLRLILNMIQTI